MLTKRTLIFLIIEKLNLLKKNVVVVNTSRGEIINDFDMNNFLKK